MSMTHKQMVCRHDHTSQQCSPARTVCDDCGLVCVTSGGQSQYDEIDRLRAENERLKKALERIGNTPKGYQDLCWEIARDALSPAPESQAGTTSTSQAVCPECGKPLRQRLPKLNELAGRVYYEKCRHGTGRKEGKR